MADPNNVKSIFLAASEKPPAERAAYLNEAVGDDSALRVRVEALLKAHDNPDSFLKEAAAEFGATIDLSPAEHPLAERPGTLIGPYKLLEQIGEGGMGVVYMADQQAPVRRRVALKIIKAGMDTRQVIARFEAERQALALMDHSNIARVLDAGATESGRPYFVMELVRGVPITEYCDQNNLSIAKRLELFGQVCQAVQHAHQKGLIHRDIKPSNVLVSTQDDRPVAKVIDFGVAKAMQGQLTEKTLFTEFQHLVGTPAYMSPEQAGGSLDIDTRSDVYSLGVLLYELLAGSPPFDPNELRSKTLAEMQRIIREVEPPTPSTRLSALDDTLATVAAQRAIEPRKLAAMVRGELDWIVMKALEKDRTRRYETPGGLARDIEHYLHDEPVLACPPSLMYRLKKFVRRNKIAAAFVLLLMAAVAALAVSNVQTRRNERRATTENAKAQAVSDLLQGMLASANPDQAKATEYTVRNLLDDFSASFGTELADQPEVEAEIRATIGRAYWRLGVPDKAEPHLTRALELRRRQFGPDHEKVAHSQVDYAWCCSEQTRLPEGEAAAREALRIYQARGTTGLPVIQAQAILQRVLINSGRHDEAQAVAEEALALARASGAEYPELAIILHSLADARHAQGHNAEAEQAARQAVEMHRRLHGPKHPETAWGLVALGNALKSQQKYPQAEAALREALAIFRERYTGDHHSLDSTLAGLKLVLEGRGDQAGLETLTRENLEDAALVADQAIVDGRLKRAQLHVERGEWDEAIDDLEQASALTKKNDKPRREKIAAAFVDAANRLQDHPVEGQDPDLREPLLRRALALNTELSNETPGDLHHLELMGHMCRRLGFLLPNRLDEARQHFEKAVEIFERLAAENPQRGGYYRDYQADTLKFLAQTFAAAGHAQEAIAAARKGVDVCQALTKEYPDNLKYREWLASALGLLAEQLVAVGQNDEAKSSRQRVVKIWEALLAEHPKDRQAQEQLASALLKVLESADGLQGQPFRDLREQLLRHALALCVELTNAFPGEPIHFEEMGHLYRRLGWLTRDNGHLDEARQYFEKASDSFEKLAADKIPQRDGFYREFQAASLTELSEGLAAAGQVQEAAEAARRVVDVRQALTKEYPDYLHYRQRLASALILLAGQLRQTGQFHEAVQVCRQQISYWEKLQRDHPLEDIKPQLASTYLALALSLTATGEVDEAKKAAERALEMGPADAQTFNQFAWNLVTTRDVAPAVAALAVQAAQQAIKAAPNGGNIWNTLGVAQYRAGTWADAVSSLTKAEELSPDKTFAFNGFFLAMAEEQLNHKDEARKWYDKSIEWMDKNQPKNEELIRFRAEAAELLGIAAPAKSTDAATQP